MLVAEAAITVEKSYHGKSKNYLSALWLGHLRENSPLSSDRNGGILPRDVGLKMHPIRICFIISLLGRNEIINTCTGKEESQVQNPVNIILFSIIHLNV